MARRNSVPKQKEHNDHLLEKLKNMEMHDDIKFLTGILKGKYPANMSYDDMRYEYFKKKYNL